MQYLLFLLCASLTCGSAIAVVISQNVVRMALYLVMSLVGTAGLYMLLHADFVAATQIMIYIGGTVVLLIFGVMLTSNSPFASLKSTPADMLKGGLVAVALFATIAATVLSVDWKSNTEALSVLGPPGLPAGFNPADEGDTTRRIGTALMGMRFDRDFQSDASVLAADQTRSTEPKTLSTGYLLVFEIISVHLLIVLIGAAYLARTKHLQRGGGPSPKH